MTTQRVLSHAHEQGLAVVAVRIPVGIATLRQTTRDVVLTWQGRRLARGNPRKSWSRTAGGAPSGVEIAQVGRKSADAQRSWQAGKTPESNLSIKM